MESHDYFILASDSPRRKALLNLLGFPFRVIPAGDEDKPDRHISPASLAEGNSFRKAKYVAERFRDAWVIGADTIVVLHDEILGKPDDENDALRMLLLLSGETHTVCTGVSLMNAGRGYSETQHDVTRVSFNTITRGEALAYVHTGEPLDKAGSYGAQGAGSALIRRIEGSYTNVVGLPLSLTIDLLKNADILTISSAKGKMYQLKNMP